MQITSFFIPTSLKYYSRTFLISIVPTLLGSIAQAQTIKYTDGNVDQSMRGSMNVDPSTLGMTFNIPLGNYPGRNVNLPVAMAYSSKVWRRTSLHA